LVAEGFSYLSNNAGRMDYLGYRRLGWPTTSSLVESLVGKVNGRVKSKQKYWKRHGSLKGPRRPASAGSVPERGWPIAALLRSASWQFLPPTVSLIDGFIRKGVHGLNGYDLSGKAVGAAVPKDTDDRKPGSKRKAI
jgi:hypothetical protein